MNKIVLITLGLILNTSVLAKSAEDIFLDMSVADNVGALYAFNEDAMEEIEESFVSRQTTNLQSVH